MEATYERFCESQKPAIVGRLAHDEPVCAEGRCIARPPEVRLEALGGLKDSGEGTALGGASDRRKRPPYIRMEQLTVKGALSESLVRRQVRRQFSRLRDCYERALASTPNLEGKIKVKLTVRRDGDTEVELLGMKKVHACFTKTLERMKAPELESKTTANFRLALGR